jgi:hypothetical protein
MSELLVTLDTDWAPDVVIDEVAQCLIARQVRATWFITHASPAINRLRRHPELFELGIHPNFAPTSTQGQTPEAVLRYCLSIAPEAVSMRTHALMQSTALLECVITTTQILTDVSLFLPHTPGLQPVEYHWAGRTLTRIPYYWEDDFEIERHSPSWHLEALLAEGEGLRVFDFHPIHVFLNSTTMASYEALKARTGRLSDATRSQMDELVCTGAGTRTLFLEVIEHLAASGSSRCIRDVAQEWRRSRSPGLVGGRMP